MKTIFIRIALLSVFIMIAGEKFAQESLCGKDGEKTKSVKQLNLMIPDDLDPKTFDLSRMNWVEAFDSMNKILAYRYAFSSWKAIDWEQKYNLAAPKIHKALSSSDTVLLTETLLEYLYGIPDGHVHFTGNLSAFERERLSGTFGLNMIPLTNGKIVANIVPEGFPAYEAGIRCGDEIRTWGQLPINEIHQLEVYHYFGNFLTNYATAEGRQLSRYQVLSRAKPGANTEITYISNNNGETYTVDLTAVEDDRQIQSQAYFLSIPMPDFSDVISYDTLTDQIGYLRILWEAAEGFTLEKIRQSEAYLELQSAISWFNALEIVKLIVDLRFNMGGNDVLGSAFAGFFYNEPAFYEHISRDADGGFEVFYTLMTEPEQARFDGEVVVMVGPNCISTGEGIPMMLQRLPNAQVVSFWGTNGSFGMAGERVIFSDTLFVIQYPFARSLNENEQIQLDSNADLEGGVQPDVRIPLTVQNVKALWKEGVDVELEYAKSVLLNTAKNQAQEMFKLFPNPAGEHITVSLPAHDRFDVLIYDLHGYLVHSVVNAVNGKAIDISHLKPGAYAVCCRINKAVSGRCLLMKL